MIDATIYILHILKKIRRIRRMKEYSQEYMAFRLGISQNAYSRLEIGRTHLTIERLFEICTILDINPFQLLLDPYQGNPGDIVPGKDLDEL